MNIYLKVFLICICVFIITFGIFVTLQINSISYGKIITYNPTHNGLGNQLFQFAAMIHYSLLYNTHKPCILYIHHLNFSFNSFKTYFNKLIHINTYSIPYISNNIVESKEFRYQQLPYIDNNVVLKGFFQNIGYVPPKDILTRYIYFDSYFVDKSNSIRTIEPNSVGIHVRLGDYKNFTEFITDRNIIYYQRAIDYIRTKRDIRTLYVFSNSMDEAIDIIKPFTEGIDIIPLDHKDDLVVLYWMTQMSCLVISNSTYSWWGGYLGNGEVIAPSPWTLHCENQEMYPSSWTVIER